MRLRETGLSPSKKRGPKIVEEEVKQVTTGDFIKDFYLELPSISEGEELGKQEKKVF